MLTHILALYQTNISEMAAAWLAEGAASVTLWEPDAATPLICWPADCTPGATLQSEITVNGQVMGLLKVDGPQGAHHATRLAADAAMLAALLTAEQDLKQLTDEFVDNQDRLLALYKLNQTTRSQLGLDDTLRLLSQEAQRMVRAAAVVMMVDADGQVIGQAQASDSTFEEKLPVQLCRQIRSLGQTGLLLREELPASTPAAISSIFVQSATIREGTDSLIGFLFSLPPTAIAPLLKMAGAIADYANGQIETALHHREIVQQARMKTELELASQIQLHLLPRRYPRIPGLDLAAASIPAREVGGDFYDFIVQPGWPFIFTVGDVSGKGMSAAMLMAMTRSVLRSRAGSLPTPSPEFVLTYSNEVMYDDFTEVGMFATVFVGRYDPKHRELSYANAGHSPVIYRPDGGPAEMLEADGPAMGVLPNSLSEDFTIPFGPNDLLVVATDGLNEAINPAGEMFGYSRLLQQVELLAGGTAQQVADELFSVIHQFSAGHPQSDDQTVMVVKGVAND